MTRPRTPTARNLCSSGARGKHLALVRLARWPPASFFVGPTELPSDGPAHGRDRHPDARLLFPQLAVAPERGVVVLFELAPQEPLLFEGGEDAPSSARRNSRREVLALPPHLQPAFEGGKGDGEDLHDLPPWDAPIHRRQSPDPYVHGENAHARHPYMGPSYSQAALIHGTGTRRATGGHRGRASSLRACDPWRVLGGSCAP